ncbi:hypothetical protein Tco_0720121 [Tanacetum coccineum]
MRMTKSSTEAILGVKSVSVKKLHGYGHLEEIVVKRSDQQLYKFKEGDFVDLHLKDIEDMLLLDVQHKLFHLDGNVIVDFIVALCMFTRSLILKKRVEDLQLGVESYQKKFNITKPQKTFPEIEFKEPYTPSYDPLGIVYEDLDKQKRVLRADELYKFSDGTLKSVRDEIHHKVLEFRLDYNPEMPKRKLTVVDRKRAGLMIELIEAAVRKENHHKSGAISWCKGTRDGLQTYDARHGPSDAMHNPSQPLKVSQKTLVSFLMEIKHISIDFLIPS